MRLSSLIVTLTYLFTLAGALPADHPPHDIVARRHAEEIRQVIEVPVVERAPAPAPAPEPTAPGWRRAPPGQGAPGWKRAPPGQGAPGWRREPAEEKRVAPSWRRREAAVADWRREAAVADWRREDAVDAGVV